MHVAVLGPLEVRLTDGPIALGAPKERAVLEMLALRAGQPVPTESLWSGLWGDSAPPSAAKILQAYISHLRHVLPVGAIATQGSGYVLQLDRGAVDATRFEEGVQEAGQQLTAANLAQASGALRQALSLWRGQPCPELTEHSWATASVARLEELRRQAEDDLADVRLALGEHDRLVGDLEAAVASEPLRERRWVQLMLALYRTGRQADALRAYARLRRTLAEELGIGPSAQLVALERSVLEQWPDLDYRPLSGLVTASPQPVPARPYGAFTAALSSFIGREAERAEVCSLVRLSRLVTVTGAGGSGKTRLAQEVAAGLGQGNTGGAFFVELAPVLEAGQVPAALATATGVLEQSGRPLQEVLAEALEGQELLIVMDNCEHVIGAAAELADTLNRYCPRVRVLATSREPLGIGGEHVYRLAPLGLPPEDSTSLEDLGRSDAVKLFVERARSHDSTFLFEEPVAKLVASICRRLDGIPLALELAAARVPNMSLTELDQRLDRRFRLLSGGSRTSLPRQRTLQATFDWSFQLLSPAEQTTLMRLSVFSGGFELEAAEAMCPAGPVSVSDVADLVGSLVDKSLVVAQRSSGSLRYSLLETVRQYGAERLLVTGGETGVTRARSAHAEYYLELAERAEPMVLGADQTRWLKKLGLEWDNLRAALEFFLSQSGRAEEILRMGASLALFFFARHERYGFDAVRAALARPDPVAEAVRAKALCQVGASLSGTLSWESEAAAHSGRAMMKEGLDMARKLGDRGLTGEVLANLSRAAEYMGDNIEAVRYAEEALEIGRSLGDDRLIGLALGFLGLAVPGRAKKKPLLTQALAHLRRAGDLADCTWSLVYLPALELADGDTLAAAEWLQDYVAISEELDMPRELNTAHCILADTTLFDGRFEEAAVWLRRALLLRRRMGRQSVPDFPNVICCVCGLGNPGDAATLTGAYNAMLSRHAPVESTYTEENPLANLEFLRQTRLQKALVSMRQALGDDNFELLTRAGANLSYDDAVDLALRVIPEVSH